jgi:hypothetical protein
VNFSIARRRSTNKFSLTGWPDYLNAALLQYCLSIAGRNAYDYTIIFIFSIRENAMNTDQDSNQLNEEKDTSKNPALKKPNILQVIGSVMAAGFGVQSSKNRERDFKQGSLKVYVIAGLIFTVLFIFTIYTIVSTVISQAK